MLTSQNALRCDPVGRPPSSPLTYLGRQVVARGRYKGQPIPYVHWPEHPLAVNGGYVPVLRLAAQRALEQRWPIACAKGCTKPEEVRRGTVVRAKDGDLWNWNVNNLELDRVGSHLLKAKPWKRTKR